MFQVPVLSLKILLDIIEIKKYEKNSKLFVEDDING